MRIWALQPYHGGSHQHFLEGYVRESRHHWKTFPLPGCHWKWRMAQASAAYAESLPREERPDLIFASSMMNLSTLKGLRPDLQGIPSVVYFHENQLTYPMEKPDQRDLQPAFEQFLSGLGADLVLYNSKFHRDEHLPSLEGWLPNMPAPSLQKSLEDFKDRCEVLSPGIDELPPLLPASHPKRLQILWSARWEWDKNPEAFLDYLVKLKDRKLPFDLHVVGCHQDKAQRDLQGRGLAAQSIGYLTRDAYLEVLQKAQLFVSTARHEFFGLSALEAAAMGCQLLVPRRLAYPEIYGEAPGVIYGEGDEMVEATVALFEQARGECSAPMELSALARSRSWPHRAAAFDDRLDALFREKTP